MEENVVLADGVDHVALAVRSVDDSLGYFVSTLGLPLVHDEELPDTGVRLAYVDAGNVLIQLVQALRPGPISEFLDERGEGLHHVCFATRDLPTVLDALGGEEPAAIMLGGRGRRTCFLPNRPSGLLIELIEHDPDENPVDPIIAHAPGSAA